MDKWKKLKDFLTDGKEHIAKDYYVSRPSVFEEILDIMEELEKRESFELEQNKCNSCQNNTDELSGECYECVKSIKDNYIEKKKEIIFAEMIMGAIKNVKVPMLIYEEEKAVVEKALLEYVSKLENELRDN